MAAADGAASEKIRRSTELALMATVRSDLDAHLDGGGFLAEYIINLGRASPSAAEFKAKLNADYADFPDYLARSFYTCIQAAADHAASEEIRQANERSLISKVCSELETRLGIHDGDRVLAEYLIYLGRASPSVEEFDAKLKAECSDLPDGFARALHSCIHAADHAKNEEIRRITDQSRISNVCSELEAVEL